MRINSIIVGGGELKEKDRRVTCMLSLEKEKKALSLKFGSAPQKPPLPSFICHLFIIKTGLS